MSARSNSIRMQGLRGKVRFTDVSDNEFDVKKRIGKMSRTP
jgi:hypothetical protein